MTGRNQFCGSPDHAVDRRGFLGKLAAGTAGAALAADMTQLSCLQAPALAASLRKQKKHVILLWLAGGASQLETWDPKPGTPTGGPFQAIPTSVPGIRICELLPKMAKLMNRVALVRSLDTKIGDHGQAAEMMQRGRRPEAEVAYPDFGAVITKELGQRDSQVPEYVSLYLATEGQRWGRPDPGFLGGRYAAMSLEKSLKPSNLELPASLTAQEHTEREHLRQYLSERF